MKLAKHLLTSTTLFLVCLWPAQKLAAQQRVALVIGIDHYTHMDRLENAVNDADSMSRVLEEMDFKVMRAVDLDREGFVRTIAEFFDQVRGADCALFYFAGHGIQAQGLNFLLPQDFKLVTENELWSKAVPLDQVISSLANSQSKVSLMILDACRDNPFHHPDQEKMAQAPKGGLAPTRPPLGSLIAYAAESGQAAVEGVNGARNGLYTGTLASLINQPGLRVEDVFNETRKKVYEQSQGAQSPAEYSKLVNTFYFHPKPGQPNLPDAVAPPKPSVPVMRAGEVAAMFPQASVPRPEPARHSAALTALRRYYDRVNQRDFPAAYAMLSVGHRQRRSLDRYRDVFSDTLAIYPTRLDVGREDGDNATLFVNLVVIDEKRNRNQWYGPVQMVNEGGEWKFDTGKDLQKVSAQSLQEHAAAAPMEASHPALTAVQSYYREVNLREFAGAYHMLSRGFQARRSVAAYSEVFQSTLSTYLMTHLLKWSTPETASVHVEVAVLDKDGNRTVWRGPVQLVNENGHWKIDTMKDLKSKD
ncbi:MAG: caspase family protein [Prosthecobacter sp.]